MRSQTTVLVLASGALAISLGTAAAAQVEQPRPSEPAVQSNSPTRAQQVGEDLEEVVVTGIRASLDRALDTKREAAGFVDAINAEDVGKLPDQNVAEALQRVTGVSIQRSRGEGDFVSIRGLGPNFVRGTVNNRTQDLEDRLSSIGANYAKPMGNWNLEVDVAYSKAEGTLDFRRVSLLTHDVVPYRIR